MVIHWTEPSSRRSSQVNPISPFISSSSPCTDGLGMWFMRNHAVKLSHAAPPPPTDRCRRDDVGGNSTWHRARFVQPAGRGGCRYRWPGTGYLALVIDFATSPVPESSEFKGPGMNKLAYLAAANFGIWEFFYWSWVIPNSIKKHISPFTFCSVSLWKINSYLGISQIEPERMIQKSGVTF